ncbi:SLC13 family permease [Bacillus sp. HMF5848]|uniref:SLC13 family permease n=1 Tax=Bacillus sp. HMF5848 TaxID=2495421 RepID=UPI000F79CD17|nr:SLC13 family permease [Bacillus sp. HMF5848]RSK27241.1 SLC13 family permease [Bacillus sp. HMF5848]
MNPDLVITFVILAITTVFFINGKFRTDIVAIGSMLALLLAGVVTAEEALAGFSNSVVIMIAGLFVVGAGIFRTGLAKLIGKQLLKLAGRSELKLLIIVMLVTAGFSGIMSNTGTVAVLLPVVISLALDMKVSPSKFLIPLAYASSLGGVLTLIGTPPNLVISQTLKDYGFEKLSFFDFTGIGLIALITGLIYMATIGRKLLPSQKAANINNEDVISPKQLAIFYKLHNELFKVKVKNGSELIEHTLREIKVSEKYNVTIIEIQHKLREPLLLFANGPHEEATSESKIEADDILLLLGKKSDVESFCQANNAEVLTSSDEADSLQSRDLGMTEILISPHSKFINHTLEELKFREKYKLNVLAINRKGYYIKNHLARTKLRFGDALLVHGPWEDIELLSKDSNDVMMIGQIEEEAGKAYAKGRAPIAAANMILMIILMMFNIVPSVVAVLIAAFLMIATGCLRNMNDAYRKINWESVILIAAMLPMSTALEKTGGVKLISDVMVSSLGEYGTYAIMAGFYVVTMILSQFISNTATAVIFAPVAITTAASLGVSPYPLLISISIAASMAFATPVATPPNALVMTAGGYQFKDFVKVGIPLQLILSVVMIICIPLFFPF